MNPNQPPQNVPLTPPIQMVGGKTTIFTPLFNGLSYANHHVMYLNNSKFFAGVIMILLNIGSKFITIQFSKSTEEYMKWTVSKQLLVFAMAWMGTRDIYTALGLTAVFTDGATLPEASVAKARLIAPRPLDISPLKPTTP